MQVGRVPFSTVREPTRWQKAGLGGRSGGKAFPAAAGLVGRGTVSEVVEVGNLPLLEPLNQNKGPARKQRQSKEYQAAEGSALQSIVNPCRQVELGKHSFSSSGQPYSR
jgi:hypothetical protein